MDAAPPLTGLTGLTGLADAALDRSVVLGYTRLGSALRRRWWPADPEPHALAGRRVLVTGATSGIGEAMARSFADLGATVHLLGRNPDKLRGVARELRLAVPTAEVVEEICDVGDLDAVRTWAADFVDRVPELHGVVHNAGVMTADREESPQGHELTLAVHVLGPHLITGLLEPALRAGGPSTVVWMSSGGMYGARLCDEEADLEYRRGRFSGVRAYARTKRMQVVLADHWAQRLAGSGVQVESMHPGWVDTPGVSTDLPTFARVVGPLLRDASDGADTAVWLVATRPASRPHHFWHDRAQRPTTVGWQRHEDAGRVRRFLAYVEAAVGGVRVTKLRRLLAWKNPLLVAVALVLVNLPAIAGAVQQHRLSSSGVPVPARVLQQRVVGGQYFVGFQVPADSPRAGDPGFSGTTRVRAASYAAARSTHQVQVRVLPGSTSVWRVDGQVTSRAGWWVTLGADVLLVAVVLLYLRFRVLSRPTLVLLAEADPVAVEDDDLLDRLGGQRYLVRGTVIGVADDGVVLAVVDRRVKVLLDARSALDAGTRVRVVGTMVG